MQPQRGDRGVTQTFVRQDAAPRATYVAPGYLFIGLLALVAGLILGLASLAPPEPRPINAGAGQFSAEAALPRVLDLLGDAGPHPIGTESNAAVRANLIAALEDLGLEVTTQEAFACREQWLICGHVVNLMTRLPGREDGPAVLLTAHYDSVGAGPGVSDDLTGVAAILETARLLLLDEPLRNPIILLFTDGEEPGLLGAEAFATHEWFEDVALVVNLEARGTAGPSSLFETSDGNAWLIDAFARAAPRPVANSLLYELYRLLPNDTDFSVYKEAGRSGVNFAYFDEVAHYHTPNDDLQHLSRASFQHHGDNVLAAARAYGEIDLSAPPAGNSLYLDVIPGQLLRVPAGWAVPLAVLALLAWVVLAVVAVRRHLLAWAGVGLSVAATLLALVLAGALSFGAVELLAAVTGRPSFFYAEPVPTRAVVWLAAFLGTLLAVVPLARRAGFWGLSAGIWLTWGLFCLVAAVALPGASIFFLVPLMASAILYGLATATPLWRSVWGPPLAGALTAAVTAYVWLPFVLALESGLGFELAPGIAVCAAVAFSGFAPLLAVPRGQGRGRATLLAATVVALVVSGALAATSENFTEDRPQRLSLIHLQSAVDGAPQSAKWLLDAFPPPVLDEELSQVARFVVDSTVRLPWNPPNLRSAQGPLLDAPSPGLTVLADERSAAGRVVTVRLSTPRLAPRLGLIVPEGSGLQAIAVPDSPYAMSARSEGRTVFTCHGAGCDGIVLELTFGAAGSAEPLTLTVADLTYGLPPEGADLLEARPVNAVPSQDGDVSVVMNEVTLPTP